MIPSGERRALIVGYRYLGLGSLGSHEGEDEDENLIIRAYARRADGRTRRLDDASFPASSLSPVKDSDTAAGDSVASARAAERRAGRAVASFDAVLSPYAFGLHDYDPFESISASLDRAAAGEAGLELALWAAMEGDLFRFAFDGPFTAALEAEKGSAGWLRFAGLNALYRAVVRAIAPAGMVPPAWSSWLRSDEAPGRARSRGGSFLERALTRPISAAASALGRSPSLAGRFYVTTP